MNAGSIILMVVVLFNDVLKLFERFEFNSLINK